MGVLHMFGVGFSIGVFDDCLLESVGRSSLSKQLNMALPIEGDKEGSGFVNSVPDYMIIRQCKVHPEEKTQRVRSPWF